MAYGFKLDKKKLVISCLIYQVDVSRGRKKMIAHHDLLINSCMLLFTWFA